jgi:hypothetical protein
VRISFDESIEKSSAKIGASGRLRRFARLVHQYVDDLASSAESE